MAIAVSTSNNFRVANSGGQVFLVSQAGVNVPTANPNNASSGNAMGWVITKPSPWVANCMNCGESSPGDGMLFTESFDLTMPNSAAMGTGGCGATTLNLLVAAKSAGLWSSDWAGYNSTMCNAHVLSWAMPTPPANTVNIHKRVEGTLALVGDLVLFSVDFTYGNGPMTVTDAIPGGGCLALVSYGPNPVPNGGSVSAPATGATSGTITWNFANSTYSTSGTVWMLLRMTCAMATGTVVTNSATATSGGNNSTSSVSLMVGAVALSLDKEESVSTFVKFPSATVTITYYLNYQINGDVLKAVRLFDDNPNGSYNSSPPLGWRILPQNGDTGTWTINDPCNTGDRIITGSVTGAAHYPDMLLDDPTPANVQMCDSGIIESDVMINPGAYVGADALIVIRSNGLTGNAGYAYSLLLSIDTAPAGGYVGMQKCGGGSCSWPTYVDPATLVITGNTWYRVKILISGNGFTFSAKIWQVGTAEPTAYQLNWTDTTSNTDANWECPDHGGTNSDWRPGVGEQGNDQDGSTQDSYNNFLTYNMRFSANTVLYDTIPTGLTYSGSNPAGSTGGSPLMVTWNLGTISDQSGSYTWWATTSACGQSFTNVGGIAGTGGVSSPPPVFSNQTVFNVICVSPTFTATPTFTPPMSPTVSRTNTPSPTRTFTDTPTPLPSMQVTKTANRASATIGDIITFSLCYQNTGTVAAPNVQLWDTIPVCILFIGSSPSITPSGGLLNWSLGNLNPGANGCVTWWGSVSCYPLNPLFEKKYYFAYGGRKVFVDIYQEYELAQSKDP